VDHRPVAIYAFAQSLNVMAPVQGVAVAEPSRRGVTGFRETRVTVTVRRCRAAVMAMRALAVGQQGAFPRPSMAWRSAQAGRIHQFIAAPQKFPSPGQCGQNSALISAPVIAGARSNTQAAPGADAVATFTPGAVQQSSGCGDVGPRFAPRPAKGEMFGG
jgi:hypothetical protein